MTKNKLKFTSQIHANYLTKKEVSWILLGLFHLLCSFVRNILIEKILQYNEKITPTNGSILHHQRIELEVTKATIKIRKPYFPILISQVIYFFFILFIWYNFISRKTYIIENLNCCDYINTFISAKPSTKVTRKNGRDIV